MYILYDITPAWYLQGVFAVKFTVFPTFTGSLGKDDQIGDIDSAAGHEMGN
jgi:hypothetical protein